jgi:Helix-turn-helix domain/Domain of unknown function (DUF1508)
MAVEANALGDYLRARRQQVRPEDVGLAPGLRRRVAGLRREELAILAGISAEYYLRLEVYMSKVAAGNGIKSVQTNARGAMVVDRTG